jgi:AAA family ATP:ADP antiporter
MAFGSVTGSTITGWLIPVIGQFNLLLLGGAILGASIGLTWIIHHREGGRVLARKAEAAAAAPLDKSAIDGSLEPVAPASRASDEPLKAGGGFQLLFKSRYLLSIALLIVILNWVNTNGQYLLDNVFKNAAAEAVGRGTTGGLTEGAYLNVLYAHFFRNVNWFVLIVQLFLVSRIFKWLGVRKAIFIPPLIALCGYGIAGLGATLLVVQAVKLFDNGTDYSLMNTIRGALYLVTTREEKYKAKAAIDTVFVRLGDVLSALTVFVGTTYLSFKLETYAGLNVAFAVVWIVLAVLIDREHRKKSAAAAAA